MRGSISQPGRAGALWWLDAALLAGLLPLLASCGLVGQHSATQAGARDSIKPTATRASGGPTQTQQAGVSPAPTVQWKLTWDDEFNKPSSLNKWVYETGGDGWSLKQLQYYDASNAAVDGRGDLVITTSTNGHDQQCWYGPCRYSSARMNTLGAFAQAYGRFEARIKVPVKSGIWPAFWMEGADIGQVGWPRCGEIDIVETNGKNPQLVQGFSHAPNNRHHGYFTLPEPLSAGFHVYRVDWTRKGITWFVDGYAYAHLSAYPGWPFDHPFFFILNVAVGGGWPGAPKSSTEFPAHMVVDWVRVYRKVTPKTA